MGYLFREDKENWTWFLQNLVQQLDLLDESDITLVLAMQKVNESLFIYIFAYVICSN